MKCACGCGQEVTGYYWDNGKRLRRYLWKHYKPKAGPGGPKPSPIPAAALLRSLNVQFGSLLTAASHLALRTRNEESWRRVLERMVQTGRASVQAADEICIALGRHISAYDPLYWEETA